MTATSPVLTQVPVTDLTAHPNNPRRDLGDLTELADSIKAQGIRSPLLVSTRDGARTVIAGHRRLAAARMAGLTDVPCILDDQLTAADEVELMLVENVQRSDLTPVEEADGYQQLLDLGVSVTMIAKKTGRSRKTVDSRIRLLSLPDAAREKVHARELTLEHAAVLVEFDDDPDAVEFMLKHAGTSNWDWAVKQKRKDRERAEIQQPIVDQLQALGLEELPADARWRDWEDVQIFESADQVSGAGELPAGAVWGRNYGGSVTLMKPKAGADERAARDAEKAAERERERVEWEEIAAEAAAASELRDVFALSVLDRKITPRERDLIIEHLRDALLRDDYLATYALDKWLEFDTDNDDEDTHVQWAARFPKASPVQAVFAMLHAAHRSQTVWVWIDAHQHEGLVAYYRLIEGLGYQVSDAERARLTPPAEDPEP